MPEYSSADIIPCSDPSCACAERRAAALRRQEREAEAEDAIRREVEECIETERTEVARRDFAAKMRDWRQNGGIPGYNGPRATRD